MSLSEVVYFRTDPETKAVLEHLAEREARSLSSLCHIILKDWVSRHTDGILVDTPVPYIVEPEKEPA